MNPKEKDAVNTLFQPISLLNVEGKIFFLVIAQQMVEHLQRNNYIDILYGNTGEEYWDCVAAYNIPG